MTEPGKAPDASSETTILTVGGIQIRGPIAEVVGAALSEQRAEIERLRAVLIEIRDWRQGSPAEDPEAELQWLAREALNSVPQTTLLCPECGAPIEACNVRARRYLDRRAGHLKGPIASPAARILEALRDD